MYDHTLYNLTQNLQGMIFQRAFQKFNENPPEDGAASNNNPLLQLRRGRAESPGWFLVQAAEFDPEPLTVDNLRVRAIWSAPDLVKALLEMMASEGWFDRQQDAYNLTDEGRTVIQSRQKRIANILNCFDAPASIRDDFTQLEALMAEVIESSLNATDPPGTWCLDYSRRRAPSDDASPIHKIVQYCSDFNAFRDDAHMASWRSHDIEGYEWETFSFVHAGKASSPDELFNQLAYRGYSRSDFADALQNLLERGWIHRQDDDSHSTTAAGNTLHEKTEGITDVYFFAPWKALPNDKGLLLAQTLQKVYDGSSA